MTNPETAKPIVQYPYRAVIGGEEHFVESWNGGNLITRNGEFVLKLLDGNFPIHSARLLEVALLQLDKNGEWLLNGHNLLSLQSMRPTGFRLDAVTRGEVLRVHKEEIHAIAWVQANGEGNITEMLDKILNFWKTASQPIKTPDKEETFAGIFRNATLDLYCIRVFAGWSEPIWLTKFHPIAKDNPYPAGVEIVPAQPANVRVEAVEPIKSEATNERQLKSVVTTKNVADSTKSVPEFFTSIEAAANYIGVTPRTILNWKKCDWLKVEQNGKKIRIAKTDLEKCKNRQ